MEALEDHHRFWPELEVELPRARRSRHASSRPLLSLGVGPLSVPLLPPLPPLVRETEAPAAAAAAPQPSGTAATPVQQLEAVLLQADPGLTARFAASGERADAAFLQRWLHARGSVEAAAAAIQAHAAWRTAFVGLDNAGTEGAVSTGVAAGAGTAAAWVPTATPSAAAGLPPLGRGITEASIADELAARKVHLQGMDISGCPVVVVQASRHDMGRRTLAHTKRLIAYVLDSACATADPERNPAGRICCLFDLSALTLHPLLLDPALLQPLLPLSALAVLGCVARGQPLCAARHTVLPARYSGAAELFPIDGAMTAWRRQQAATAAAEAASVASSASGSSSGGSGRRSRAASALRRGASATRSFVHHRMVRPVGGAAAGAARALRGHHAQLLARRRGMGRSLPPEQQRSLLAQVVLTHVLLVGLLLRMLQRVLLLRGPAAGSGAAAGSSGKQHSTQGSKAEPAGSGATSTEAAAAPAGPADI
ncbi:hypothetical protein COHA_009132 [Chlorella ohadii]|uniref:CRAL-TRIO domain-containing protein n=1 Tax=Chlorella ohadii TaxID=2649997 RepID=A0AAD5DHN7_9CHLO|nr:hypothetical protein COHA_009132 [Chlorella ohadii]